MRQDGLPNVSFPRPGPALLGVLIAIACVGIVNALSMGHGEHGSFILDLFACVPSDVLTGRVWQLVTAGFVTVGFWHLVFTMLGLYFFSTDLEQRWGRARYLRFLGVSIVVGYALATLVHLIVPASFGGSAFHPGVMYGAGPAITAMVLAWTMRNPTAQIRIFFVLPLTGRALFWITIVFCFAGLIFPEVVSSEGAIAPIGGVLTALVLSGEASPLRTLYLKAKLAVLKKRVGKSSGALHPILRGPAVGKSGGGSNSDRPSGSGARSTSRSSRAGGPPLRVVYGGLEEELRNRKPPKDKRDLN